MTLTIIAAHSIGNQTIGKDGRMPWHLTGDLRRFKSLTLNSTVLMGSKTFDSLGKIPLQKRHNIVVTRDPYRYREQQKYKNLVFIDDLDAALEIWVPQDLFCIGGAELYGQTINKADKLLITEVMEWYEGDTFFPEYHSLVGLEFREVSRELQPDGTHQYVEYHRIKPNG